MNNYILSSCRLGLVEIMNPSIHGNTAPSSYSPELYVSYFNQDNEYEHLTIQHILSHIQHIGNVEQEKHNLNNYPNNYIYNTHFDIRNYNNIIHSQQYLTPKIIKVYTNGQNVLCAVDNTFWLRVLQRTIRKRIQNRNEQENINNINNNDINNNENNDNINNVDQSINNNNLNHRLYYSGGRWYRYNL